MAFLEQFSDEEKKLLVSLPYRAGIWISTVDRSGGAESKKAELEALEKIMDEKARGMFESALVHEVMAEACTHKSDWPEWAQETRSITADCERAVAVIAQKLSAHDVEAYRSNLMHISVSVARAFREFNINASFFAQLVAAARIFLDKLVGKAVGQVYESESLLNISFEEDVALAGLSKALGLSGNEEDVLEDNEGNTNE